MAPSLPKRYSHTGSAAKGGFGDVLFCEDQHLQRKVAIKFLQDPATDMRRLLDELRALLLMRSKHVVQVLDIVPSGSELIGIVEEFIDGEDLWNSKIPLSSPTQFLKTLWQIACGIADIHAFGIIHRDIKPNNMKFDPEGIVKIFDFGLARDEGPTAETKGFVGTPGFAAPELYSHSKVTFTNEVDVYAFGASAAFLANGNKLPPELLSIPAHPLPIGFYSAPNLGSPPALATLLEQCLAKNPTDRPAMSVVRDEIARHLLRDTHQALAVFKGKTLRLDATRRTARLDLPNVGQIEINYDGLRFNVAAAQGEVSINNSPAVAGMELPGSCVVALGNNHRRANDRAFITFDVSNPEVVL